MSKSEKIKLLQSILEKTQGKIMPIYWVPEELKKYSKEFPLETMECVDKMIKHYQTDDQMYSILEYFKDIFSNN